MGYNQPMQSNPQEQFVQVPLDIETNQNSASNHRPKNWLTIIICIILAVTGQSVVGLLENYYFLHRNRSGRYGFWTQSLFQFVGFPILLFPYIILLLLSSKKKQNFIMSSSNGIILAIIYPVMALFLFYQASFSNVKHYIPFRVFTLIYTTQLLFTPVFAAKFNKIKFNRWMIISLVFAILSGAFTLYTFSPVYRKIKLSYKVISLVVYAALLFSLILCLTKIIFDSVYEDSTTKKQPSFAVVLEFLIFTFLFATGISVAAIFISGEHQLLKRQMDGFSKGEFAYVRTLVGLAVAWQVYWVGIMGLVFAVSAVFSNVISVCTWPIVSLLVAVFYYTYEQYNALSATALATAALSVTSYFYLIHKDKSDSDETTS